MIRFADGREALEGDLWTVVRPEVRDRGDTYAIYRIDRIELNPRGLEQARYTCIGSNLAPAQEPTMSVFPLDDMSAFHYLDGIYGKKRAKPKSGFASFIEKHAL